MKFTPLCAGCIVKQVPQLAVINNIDEQKEHATLRKVLNFFAQADFSLSTPELMGQMWDIIATEFGERDLYRPVKIELNKAVLTITEKIRQKIEYLQTPYEKYRYALCADIAGNLIDFAASDTLNMDFFLEQLEKVQTTTFGHDDSETLFANLSKARTVLVLGDNCGEIALDKLFIMTLKLIFPNLQITYAVKGQAVLNDVTIQDAEDVHMSEAAVVISNGDKSAGTVLTKVSAEFRELFYAADVVISKGQGNYESLYIPDRATIFFLYMAKCPVTAKMANVPLQSIVCKGY